MPSNVNTKRNEEIAFAMPGKPATDSVAHLDEKEHLLSEQEKPGAVVTSSKEQKLLNLKHQQNVNSTWYREQGNIAFKQKDFNKALENYTKGIRHMPTCKLLCNRSLVYSRLERLQEALRDADLALKVDASNVKALVRRANVLKQLRRYDEAVLEVEKALKCDPNNCEITNLERDLKNVSSRIALCNQDESELKSKPGIKSVQDLMSELEGALEHREQPAKVSSNLSKLQRLLSEYSNSMNYFIACSGMTTVIKLYSYDNHKVLAIVLQILEEEPSIAEQMDRKTMEIVVQAVKDRRVAVIGLGLKIVDTIIERLQDLRDRFYEEQNMSVLLSIFCKGPEILSNKAASILEKLASFKKFNQVVLNHNKSLHDGICRACLSSSLEAKGLALSILLKVKRSKAVSSLLSTSKMASSLYKLFQEAISIIQKDESDGNPKIVLTSLSAEQLSQLGDMLGIFAGLSLTKEFVDKVSKSGLWIFVVQIMKTESIVQERALEFIIAASKAMPEVTSIALQDKDLFDLFANMFIDVTRPEYQRQTSIIFNMLCNFPEFQSQFKASGLDMKLQHVIGSKLSPTTIIAMSRIMYNSAKNETEFLNSLCNNGAFLQKLVEMWYSSYGYVKQYVFMLTQLLLSEERGSQVLTELVSEGQVLSLIKDLSQQKVLADAFESGGASLLNAMEYNDILIVEKRDFLARIDQSKLCDYIHSLQHPGQETVAVDICAGSGMFCITLAKALNEIAVYAVDWDISMVNQVKSMSRQAQASNLYPVLCDYEAVNGLPAKADLTVLIGLWNSIEDPPSLYKSIQDNLNKDGKVILVEEKEKLIRDAEQWAIKAGFEIYAEPKHIERCYIRVLQTRYR